MQFIKTLFWVILAVVLVIFAVNNWSPTSVLIWEDVRIDSKLPVLVIGAFLLGFLPTYLVSRSTKWRLTRRIKTLEAAARPAPAASAATTTPPKPLDLKETKIVEPAPAVSAIDDGKANDA